MSCGRILSVLKTKWKQLRWWLIPMNVHCKHFCPFCKYYSQCVKDTLYELFLEDLYNVVDEYHNMEKEIEKWL